MKCYICNAEKNNNFSILDFNFWHLALKFESEFIFKVCKEAFYDPNLSFLLNIHNLFSFGMQLLGVSTAAHLSAYLNWHRFYSGCRSWRMQPSPTYLDLRLKLGVHWPCSGWGCFGSWWSEHRSLTTSLAGFCLTCTTIPFNSE